MWVFGDCYPSVIAILTTTSLQTNTGSWLNLQQWFIANSFMHNYQKYLRQLAKYHHIIKDQITHWNVIHNVCGQSILHHTQHTHYLVFNPLNCQTNVSIRYVSRGSLLQMISVNDRYADETSQSYVNSFHFVIVLIKLTLQIIFLFIYQLLISGVNISCKHIYINKYWYNVGAITREQYHLKNNNNALAKSYWMSTGNLLLLMKFVCTFKCLFLHFLCKCMIIRIVIKYCTIILASKDATHHI